MGMPFPLGLRIVSRFSQKDVIWMYGINGIGSVLGGIIGVIIAFAFTYSLAFGDGVYFMALAIMALIPRIVKI